jgi:D-hexose-6-phosphate mutarotase
VAAVALNGGHVLSFQPRGERPVLWTSAQSQYVEGKRIRRGIPVCWPWFGPHPTDPDKPAHGFARTSSWRVVAADADDGQETRLRFGLTDSDATRTLWPHPFHLELEMAAGLPIPWSRSYFSGTVSLRVVVCERGW